MTAQRPRAGGALPARKPQSKSRLDRLPAELLAQLEVWLLDQNRSYDEVCGLLAKEHGVATTKSSLSRYYQRWLVPKRQARALCDGRRLGPRAAEDGEVAALARARQLALAALMQPEPDLTTAQRLLEMVTALEQTRLAQLRVKLGLRL